MTTPDVWGPPATELNHLHALVHLADATWSTDQGTAVHGGTAASVLGAPAGDVHDWLGQIAASPVPAPGKLALLANLKGRDFPDAALSPLALSLVRADLPDADRSAAAARLVAAVSPSTPDPLGRDPATYFRTGGAAPTSTDPAGGSPHEGLLSLLLADVSSTLLAIMPKCKAARVDESGQPTLAVETRAYSSKPLGAFKDIVDPLDWPRCFLQGLFFKSMELRTDKAPVLPPDQGWTATVRETVDFGSSLGEMCTDLTMTFTHDDDHHYSSHYTFAGSPDGRITHDEGYLVVEDLVYARCIRTSKNVWFTDPNTNLAPAKICGVWSMASALISLACTEHSASASA